MNIHTLYKTNPKLALKMVVFKTSSFNYENSKCLMLNYRFCAVIFESIHNNPLYNAKCDLRRKIEM